MIHDVREIRIRASVIDTQNKPTAAMRLGISPDTFEFFRRQYGVKMPFTSSSIVEVIKRGGEKKKS